MPWALLVVAIPLVAMEIPRFGPSVAGYLVGFTNLVTQSVEKAVVPALAARISGPNGSRPLWLRFGWAGVVWLAAIVALCAWLVAELRMGRSGHGLANLLVVMVGWPICFHLAKRVMLAAE